MAIKNILAAIILKEIPTDGHSPLLVIGDNYKKYIAKNGKGHVPPITIINECISNHFLSCWEIPIPDFALIRFDQNLLAQKELSNYHRSHFYDEWAYGSEYIDSIIEVTELAYTDKKATFNRILNPMDFFHIALFDTWIENDDRKPSNYNLLLQIVSSQYRIIPIDHAFIFSTLGYEALNPAMFSPSFNEHLLVSEFAHFLKHFTVIDDGFILKEQHYFYFCVDKCAETVDNFFSELSGFIDLSNQLKSKIKDFLFDKQRNKKVFEEYILRLKQ